MSEQTARRALLVILGFFLVLGAGYSVVNPIFESPDEALNYANIRFLVEERRLPVLSADEPTKAHHPPAYYVLGALLTHWVPNKNYEAVTDRVNAFWIHRVDEPGVDNKNLYLHDPALEQFPYRDVALGVHLVRWLSILLSVVTILCIYLTARELIPERPALAVAAAALVAFNPMFLYISASVHDDALANLVAAATLLVTSRLLTRGPTLRRAVMLGGLLGLALLTKLTCLLVAPTVGLALLISLNVNHDGVRWGELLRFAGAIGAVALLVGGWWLARNQIVYGEPTSMARQVKAWGGLRPNAPNIRAAVRELGFLHDSFWGVFGYGQLPMPKWIYALPRLLGILFLGGWTLGWARRRSQSSDVAARTIGGLQPSTLAVLSSAGAVTLLVVFVRMVFIDTANFGRYLFVALGFLAPLYAIGLGQWGLRMRNRTLIAIGSGAVMFGLAMFALLGVLLPAYGLPKMLSPEQVEARADPVEIQFGQSIRLVGKRISADRLPPGGEMEITLCWESMGRMEKNYVTFVHLLGEEERIVAARSTHPGLGRYPTARWSPGDRFCDTLDLEVEDGAPAPAVYDVEIGWHEAGSSARLPAYASDGSTLELVLVDRVKVAPDDYQSVHVPHRIDANLGGEVTLLGYDLVQGLKAQAGGEIPVTLYWKAQVAPQEDYTVFLHLAASAGPPHAQDDSQPQHGAYPTSFWDAGEVVTETRTISIPTDLAPEDYPLVAGMYVLGTGKRLSLVGPDGSVLGDSVMLETVRVEPSDS